MTDDDTSNPRGLACPGKSHQPGHWRRSKIQHSARAVVANRGDRAQPRPARPARRDTDLARLRKTGLLDPLPGPQEASRQTRGRAAKRCRTLGHRDLDHP